MRYEHVVPAHTHQHSALTLVYSLVCDLTRRVLSTPKATNREALGFQEQLQVAALMMTRGAITSRRAHLCLAHDLTYCVRAGLLGFLRACSSFHEAQ